MKPKIERNQALVEKRDKGGLSFRIIGLIFGISHVTAYQIYRRTTQKKVNV